MITGRSKGTTDFLVIPMFQYRRLKGVWYLIANLHESLNLSKSRKSTEIIKGVCAKTKLYKKDYQWNRIIIREVYMNHLLMYLSNVID